jgi:putative PIN family toxin of toxin-antitoxin system
MKAVIDVNVWVSGLLWGGPPNEVIQLIRGKKIVSYISAELELELVTTLHRQKLQPRIQQRQQTAEGLAAIAKTLSERVEIAKISVNQLRDPKDEKILATAKAAAASYLITGDQDLLVLHSFEGIEILTPTQFLGRYGNRYEG